MPKNEFKLDKVSVRLVQDAPLFSEEPVNSPSSAAHLLGKHICDFDREVVAIVNLNNRNMPINAHIVSIGAIDYAVAHPREILKVSYLSNAKSLIMLHNHPSGDVQPGLQDTKLTKHMLELCKMAEIPLIDHIIVSNRNNEYKYFSFTDEGVLDYLKGELSKTSPWVDKVADVGESYSTTDKLLSFGFEYTFGRRSLDGVDKILAGFTTLTEAKEYVDKVKNDFTTDGFFFVKAPEGEYIYGCDFNEQSIWYEPDERAYVYDNRIDGIAELNKDGVLIKDDDYSYEPNDYCEEDDMEI